MHPVVLCRRQRNDDTCNFVDRYFGLEANRVRSINTSAHLATRQDLSCNMHEFMGTMNERHRWERERCMHNCGIRAQATQHLLIPLQIQCRWWSRTKNVLPIEITSREYYDCWEWSGRYDPSTDDVPATMYCRFQAKAMWKCMFAMLHEVRDKMPQFMEIEISFWLLSSEINRIRNQKINFCHAWF